MTAAQQRARASAMLDLQRYEEAASLLAQLVTAEPGDSQAWCLLARAHLGAGRPGEALMAANRAVAVSPAHDWPHRIASTALLRLGNKAEAMRAALEATRLAPQEWRAHLSVAQAAIAIKTYSVLATVAEPAAAAALKLAPGEPDVHFTAGQVSFARGNMQAARTYHERALALDPAHAAALNELGRISLRHSSPIRAARQFLRATRTAPAQGVYGHNIEVAVRRAVSRMIYATAAASSVVLLLAVNALPVPAGVIAGAAGSIALTVGISALLFRRMPRELRQLLRRGRFAVPMAICYGSLLAAVLALAASPDNARQDSLAPAFLMAICARLATLVMWQFPRRTSSGQRPQPPGG